MEAIMGGNSFGSLFRSRLGESHGKALGVLIDGCPSHGTFEEHTERNGPRGPGKGWGTSPRKEKDRDTSSQASMKEADLGTPISILLWNEDVDSTPYDDMKDVYRPGQGDFTYQAKYGIRDHRGGGRSSARETAARVAAGAIAKKILEKEKIEVRGYTLELGGIRAEKIDLEEVNRNFLRCPDKEAARHGEEDGGCQASGRYSRRHRGNRDPRLSPWNGRPGFR
jgi:chorismate synthase